MNFVIYYSSICVRSSYWQVANKVKYSYLDIACSLETDGESPFGGRGQRLEDNIKMDLKEIGWMGLVLLLSIRVVTSYGFFFVFGKEHASP
jgi:hypothetical protein